MHSIRQLIDLSSNYLQTKGIFHPRLSAEEILAFVLKRKRLDLYIDYDEPVETKEVDAYRALIKRKGKGEPLGYLFGYAEFLGCRLALSPAVLIPRQETEILLHMALKQISNEPKVLWDLCTGSGCMGLAAKKHRPELQVTLSDLSQAALAIAAKNAEENELFVECIYGDLLTPFQGRKADYIFCNPPYVSEEDYCKLEKEVHFEPKEALLAQEGGLEFYKRLAGALPSFLNPNAKIFLEIGHGQKEDLFGIFHQSHWKQMRCEKDWAGLDRFFFLEFHPE